MRKKIFLISEQFYFGYPLNVVFLRVSSLFPGVLIRTARRQSGRLNHFVFVSKNVADQKIETIPFMTIGKNKTFSSTGFYFF